MRSLIEDEVLEDRIDISPDGISLDLLRAVYRNKSLPLPTRMRAAGMAIPYECCRLGISVVMNDGNDIATLLDQRIAKMEQMKQLPSPTNAAVPKINGAAVHPAKPPQIEAKAPLAHTVDRRYRRI